MSTDDQLQLPTVLGRQLVSANSFQIDTHRPYIVKNLLLGRQVSMLCGSPNTGKSAVISCIASHVAMGRDFAGYKAQRAGVVYVAAEDPNGIGERAFPYMTAASQSTAPFYILGRSLDLSNPNEVNKFIGDMMNLLAGTGLEHLLIILDTMNLCIGDGDENSARDMGRAIGSAQRIAQATGAHVLISHHTSGHDKSRPRGSTAMDGNVDTMLILHRADASHPEGVVFITQEKQRSVRKGQPITFKIDAFDAGVDSEGDQITVPMAVPYVPKTSLKAAAPKRAGKPKAPVAGDGRAEDVQRVLGELAAADAAGWHDPKAIGARTGTPFNDVRDNPDSLRKAVARALDTLTRADVIERSPAGGYRLRDGIGEPEATVH